MSFIITVIVLIWVSQKIDVVIRANRAKRIRQEQKTRQEQARLAREQERLAREQSRQAERIAKAEARLMTLEQRITNAERTISHFSAILEDLRQQAQVIDNRIWYYSSKGLPCETQKKELLKLNERIFQTESKIIRAEQTKALAEKQMKAA